MSTVSKKPPPSKSLNPRPSPSPNSPTSRASTSNTPNVNGLGRSPSFRNAIGMQKPVRGGLKRPSPNTSFLNTTNNTSDDASEDDARAEHASLVEELKSRLVKAETASEEYQRQLNMLQAKLNESLVEHGRMEEQLHSQGARIEEFEAERLQVTRQQREMEDLFESERMAMVQDKAEQKGKEEEQQAIIKRLKETLAQREIRTSGEEDKGLPRSLSFPSRSTADIENGHFAPPSSLQRSDSRNNSKLVMQKDRLIESLRLELAEAQIKIVEMENMGGGRMHELEKTLLETRITNARLMEDNESFQLLLSEKTLNGDFTKTDVMHVTSGLGSLAEELESAEGESDNYRKLEIEARSLKDQNKALTLYVENIIGRLLQHKEFENILDKTPDLMSGKPRPAADTDKDLPPPPPAKPDEPPPSMLQRAKSVVAGTARRPRPISQAAPPTVTAPTVNEDPSTAPSVPLGRSQSTRGGSHRRSQSEMPNAGPIVNQMYRGPPSTGSNAPLGSPGLSAGNTAARSSFFASTTPSANPSAPSSRVPSSSLIPPEAMASSSNSTFSDHSGEVTTGSSPPRAGNARHANNYTGAIMTQSKLRPLRLVQENRENEGGQSGSDEDVAARKKANRGSWMPGWFNRAKEEDARNSSPENNIF